MGLIKLFLENDQVCKSWFINDIYSCESFRSRQSSRNVRRQELSWLLVQEFNLNPSHATHDEPDDLGDRHIDRADIKNYVGQEHFEIALCPDIYWKHSSGFWEQSDKQLSHSLTQV